MHHTIHDSDRFPPALATVVPVLADALRALDDDDHIVIDVRGNDRYVQYATFDDNIRAESVGNAYILESPPLDADDLVWLTGHGWNLGPGPGDPSDCGNHWRHWSRAEATQAAIAGVVTLHRIHGARTPDDLRLGLTDRDLIDALHARYPAQPHIVPYSH